MPVVSRQANTTGINPMNTEQSLSHTRWECKYHVVFIPKCRRKALYGRLRKELSEVFHELARQRECRILEGHMMKDHVHMLIEVPPKYAVSQVVGFIKGKSAMYVARVMGRKRNFTGQSFWARGYYVNTVGRDEEVIANYIRHQEKEDARMDQLSILDDEE
jgi:putative transposase